MDGNSFQPLLFMLITSLKKEGEANYFAIICFVVFSLLTKLIYFDELRDYIFDFFKNNNDSEIVIKLETQIIKTGSYGLTRTDIYSSEIYQAVSFFINKIENLKYFDKKTETMIKCTEKDGNKGKKIILLPIDNPKVQLNCDGIEIVLYTLKNRDDDDSKNKNTSTSSASSSNILQQYGIKLTINKKKYNNAHEIMNNFLEKCKKEYEHYMNPVGLKLLVFKGFDSGDDIPTIKITNRDVFHNKDLEKNIFFEGKDEFIDFIRPFINDSTIKSNSVKETYTRFAKVFNCKIILHGKPGTGKSTLIKAISKFLNRHIFSYKITDDTTNAEVQEVFSGKIGGFKIDEVIIVLEDFDQTDTNIFLKDDIDGNECIDGKIKIKSEMAEISEQNNSLEALTKKIISVEKKDKLVKSTILEVFEGLQETENMFLILTTNHLQNINPIMIRNGRINKVIEIKEMTLKNLVDYLSYGYSMTREEIYEKYSEILEYRDSLTSAKISDICIQYMYDIETCIKTILHEQELQLVM